MSKWLRSMCCDAPLFLLEDLMKDLEWIYCACCCRRIGVILGEEKYDLDNSQAKFIPDDPLRPFF